MSTPLKLHIATTGLSTVTLKIEGRVDSETADEFDKLVKPLTEKRLSKVLVDMSQCHYVSSAGIRAFFEFRKKMKARQGAVSFFALQPQIKKVFEIVKALPLECIFSSIAEADAYLDRVMSEELKKSPSKK